MNNPLLDTLFLRELDSYRNRITYVRLTSLTTEGLAIERIEGVAVNGNITIDGNSAVRRICSLTMTTQKLNINNIYWGISARIKIEIGLQQDFTKKYDNLIWFPMGVFILTDFKTSQQVNNYTITLSGKDKMCLLNGDVSGNFNAETDLGQEEVEQEDGKFVKEKRSISYIIREMVHHYAQEPFENIIIKNIDEFGLNILRNHTDHDFYLIQEVETDNYIDIIDPTDETVNMSYTYYGFTIHVNFANLANNFQFVKRVDEDNLALVQQLIDPTYIATSDGIKCQVVRIAPEEDIGYEVQDLIYPEDLIAAPNETVTSILDKIIKTFGEYEYFYNLQGQFVFQAKQTYINTAWNNIIQQDNEQYVKPAMVSSLVKYSFESNNVTTAYQNTPNIGKIKNDYTVWGKKRAPSSGVEIPIHMRYAIDRKPYFYASYPKTIAAVNDDENFATYQDVYVTQEFYDTVVLTKLKENNSSNISVIYRTEIPNWLKKASEEVNVDPSGWWTVLDWAEYYKSLAGEYPQLRLLNYHTGTAGFTGTIEFPNGYTHHLRDQLIFDVDGQGNPYFGAVPSIETWPAYTRWSPFQHGYRGCMHTFEYFRQMNIRLREAPYNTNVTSWIFRPKLPDEIAIFEQLSFNGQFRINIVDWREIIYQMAIDYYQHNHDDDFYLQIHKNNYIELFDLDLYKNGRTGYEHYYHDLQGFWRILYAPESVYDWDQNIKELNAENYNDDGWNKDIIENPASLIFWFDFFDADGLGLGKFSIPAIGNRPKNSKNDSIRVIIYKDVPDVIFIKASDYNKYKEAGKLLDGYTYVQITSIDDNGNEQNKFLADYLEDNKIMKSARSKTCQQEIDDLVYQNSYANENITITSIPIYYLEPNTIISAKDEQKVINGYYILNKMTIPLKYNGTMQITATRVPERIY